MELNNNKLMKLNNKWILWAHSISDNSWSTKSYKQIYEINNIYDWKILNEYIKQIYLQNVMLFIMKDNIFPTWEHPDNRAGCCVSYRIPQTNIIQDWNILVENIILNKIDIDNINGLSISPKKEFNIIKIWFKTNLNEYNLDLNKNIKPSNMRIKSHF